MTERKKKTGKKDASANSSDLKTGGAPFESQLDHWPSRRGFHGLLFPVQTNVETVTHYML